MKAVIIADNDLVIDNVRQVLKSRSYDTIAYRWLLKALDNLEEIAPHLIVVSQRDYPRHWKTITQYAKSGISGFYPQVILYTKEDFDEEEIEKAKALGVRGTFSSVDVEGLDELREILEIEDDIFAGEEFKEKVVEVEEKAEEEVQENIEENIIEEQEPQEPIEQSIEVPEEEVQENIKENIIEEPQENIETPSAEEQEPIEDKYDNGLVVETSLGQIDYNTVFDDDPEGFGDGYEHISFMFTNPQTGVIVTGTTSQFNGSTMEFLPDFSDFTDGLELGNEIPVCTIKRGNEVKSVSAQVTDKTADGLMLFIKEN